MGISNSLENTLMLGKIEGRKKKWRQRMMRWLDAITNSMHMRLSNLQEIVKDRNPGVLHFLGSQRVGHNLPPEQQNIYKLYAYLMSVKCSIYELF